MKANQYLWNELTEINVNSPLYDLAGFKSGKSTLKPVELAELGDVAGKSLLHLQCQFGLDTMSFARLGAIVSGVDYSERAIAMAKALSEELSIPARFVCSNIYDLTDKLSDQFDIIFTSYGVLCWLPDLAEWARIIAHHLKPGGIFYIVESHPFLHVFENERTTPHLRVRFSYFPSSEPTRWEPDGSYADRNAKIVHPSFEWTHNLSEIINTLIASGLRIEFLHEFPYMVDDHFPFMDLGADGYWRLKGGNVTIPLMFSLKATKVDGS